VPIDIPLLNADLTRVPASIGISRSRGKMARTAQGTGLVVRAQQKP
jgi:hypothetical protein